LLETVNDVETKLAVKSDHPARPDLRQSSGSSCRRIVKALES
jgi:hypothetical protein